METKLPAIDVQPIDKVTPRLQLAIAYTQRIAAIQAEHRQAIQRRQEKESDNA